MKKFYLSLMATLFLLEPMSLSATEGVKLFFPFSQGKIILSFRQNEEKLAHLDQLMDTLQRESVQQILLTGSASPEGAAWFNEYLSQERARSLRLYIAKKYAWIDSLVVESFAVAKHIPSDSAKDYRYASLDIILKEQTNTLPEQAITPLHSSDTNTLIDSSTHFYPEQISDLVSWQYIKWAIILLVFVAGSFLFLKFGPDIIIPSLTDPNRFLYKISYCRQKKIIGKGWLSKIWKAIVYIMAWLEIFIVRCLVRQIRPYIKASEWKNNTHTKGDRAGKTAHYLGLNIQQNHPKSSIFEAMNKLGGNQKHHIIAEGMLEMARSRDIWVNKLGRDIDDARNGILLPDSRESKFVGAFHKGNHDRSYFQELDRRLVEAFERGGVSEFDKEMDVIKRQLFRGKIRLNKAHKPNTLWNGVPFSDNR